MINSVKAYFEGVLKVAYSVRFLGDKETIVGGFLSGD